MIQITITEWNRYGHHRGYAIDASETKLGHVDLKTGEVTLEDGVPAEPVTSQLVAWARGLSQQMTVAPAVFEAPPVLPVVPPEPEPIALADANVAEPDWSDLAESKPGAAVREKAQQEWDEYHARKPVISNIAKFLMMDTPDRSWARGADGEEVVGARLQQLEDLGWRALHSIPIGTRGSDIDHLLIGPGGVFTINTKNHDRAKVWVGERMIIVNGQKTDHLRNSRYEGKRVSDILTRTTPWSVPVTPTVIILADTYTVKRPPPDVLVIRRRDVPSHFKRLPAIYSDEAVSTIYDAARRSTTWS